MPRHTYAPDRPRPAQPPTPRLHLLAAQCLAALDRGEVVTIVVRQTGASTTWFPDGTTIDRTPDAEEARPASPAPSGATPTHIGEGLDRHHRTH